MNNKNCSNEQVEIEEITKKLIDVLKNETNFAILNTINVNKHISLSELDKKLNKPDEISDSLNQLIEFELITPSFERRSPINVYFSIGKAGKIVLESLAISKKESDGCINSFNEGTLSEDMTKYLP